jgi:RNA polymerase sigma-70 factor (ECF subfamily)
MLVSKKICDGLSDTELVRKALEEVDFFSCLYNRYEAQLLRYICHLGQTPVAEAEDILQEAFIKVWRNLRAFNPAMKLSSWLYRIVHNQVISSLRQRRSFGKDRVVLWKDALMGRLPADEPLPNDQVDETALTHEVVEQLPLPYREVLMLRYFEQMSYEDISDVLELPEGTVATRLNRARRAFARLAAHTALNPQNQ